MFALYSWGANSYGQLALEYESEQSESPVAVNTDHLSLELSGVKAIYGGGGHSVLLDNNGTLYAAGWNSKGQLGTGNRNNLCRFEKVPFPYTVDKVACGWDFTLILTTHGDVYGCGSNAYGQICLQDEEAKFSDTFRRIKQLSNVKEIACGLRHSVCLKSDGRVFTSGCCRKFQTGIETSEKFVNIPTEVKNLPSIKKIAAGQFFSLLLAAKNNALYGFGDNKFGQLLHDTSEKSIKVPTKLTLPDIKSTLIDISCGWTHSVILFETGEMFTAGRNIYGQLGQDTKSDCSAQWVEMKDVCVTDIAIGSEHGLLVDISKKLYSWGWNEHGNCGNNSTLNLKVPVKIDSFGPSYSVSCLGVGSAHNFAVIYFPSES